MFFDKLGLWSRITNAAILHFAPEKNLEEAIARAKPKRYVKADLFSKSSDVARIDATDINIPDSSFDLIICNHVLEHIYDDAKAMAELFRVLKSGGQAVLQTPYSSLLAGSIQDANINSDELRRRIYGQEDHVRIYGLDLFDRLRKTGFQLQVKRHGDFFSSADARYYGVNREEDLILVSK